jgi:hypothetical protein
VLGLGYAALRQQQQQQVPGTAATPATAPRVSRQQLAPGRDNGSTGSKNQTQQQQGRAARSEVQAPREATVNQKGVNLNKNIKVEIFSLKKQKNIRKP